MSDDDAVPTGAGIGQSVRDWVEEEGMLEKVEAAASQEAIAWQLEQAMTAKMSKAELPIIMAISRSQVHGLLKRE